MLFVIVGVIVIALKLLAYGDFEDLSWFWCLVPFGLAFFYWEVVDPMFQITPKMEMKKQVKRAKRTKQKQLEELLATNLHEDRRRELERRRQLRLKEEALDNEEIKETDKK